MPSLILVIFVVQVLIHVINSVGKTAVNELLWILYNKLPTSTSESVQSTNKQRREVLRLRKEMTGTSAQDEFSKWAKLRRQHDRANADYEKSSATLKSSRAQFDTIANTLRWLGTTGLRWFLQFWYSSQPIYWIPRGWLPYYVEWILSFPRAPLGAISVQVWWVACASVVQLVSEAVVAGHALMQGEAVDQRGGVKGNEGRRKMAFGADGGAQSEKKEL